MNYKSLFKYTALALTLTTSSAMAAPIIMEGDFVRTAVSDDGTLGLGENTAPGLLHDITGTGTFGVDDYLTPGTAFEIFSVSSTESGLLTNNNDDSDSMSGTLTDVSGLSVYDNAVNWAATIDSFFTISTDTFFNDGDERIGFSTTITALTDLTELSFLRAIDPDPDVVAHGDYNTINGRGNGSLTADNWVHSLGATTGLTLGLYSDSDVTHNTGIREDWSVNPADYLLGQNDGNGDNVIGLAFDIGSLSQGSSTTFDYYYVMGDSLSTVDIPVDVPEPSTLAIFALGVMGLTLRKTIK